MSQQYGGYNQMRDGNGYDNPYNDRSDQRGRFNNFAEGHYDGKLHRPLLRVYRVIGQFSNSTQQATSRCSRMDREAVPTQMPS